MKKCSADGCSYPVFGKGFCKNHQYLRKDLKKKDSSVFEKDKEFYLEIWLERPHVCSNCKAPLGDEPRTYFFDHILEKGNRRYAHLRHEKNNIWLLCGDCHSLKTNGMLTEIMKKMIIFTKNLFNLQ